MSYILDALRKADAQRKADATPSLHTNWEAPAIGETQPRNIPLLATVLLAVAALAAGALLTWLVLRPSLPAEQINQPAPVSATPVRDTAMPMAAMPPVASTPARTGQMPAAQDAAPALPPAPKPRSEPVAERATSKTPPPPTESIPQPAPQVVTQATPAAAAPPTATIDAGSYRSLPTLQELPAAIRQKIPALATGGYIYSSKQAERSILINGHLRQEGDEIAPGMRLESMTPEGLILSYQGKRFRQNY